MINKIPDGTFSQKGQMYFLLVILLITFILVFLIFRPFIYALIFAAVFSIMFKSIYKKIIVLTRGWQKLAAFITVLITIIFIFVPLIFLGIQIVQEAQQLYSSLIVDGEKNTFLNILNNLIHSFQSAIGGPATQNLINTDEYLKQGLEWLLKNFGVIFSNFAKLLMSSLIFLIAFYYLLKDGSKIKKSIITLSPLANIDNEAIFKKLKTAVNSVVRGNLIIALIQGMVAAIGFVIFGIPNAVLWGSIAAIAALIPGVGTSLVLTPAIIFLFLTNEFFNGFGLLIWGMVAVGLVDNFLGPKLISTKTQLHPFIILLSVLGGMIFFGPIGFIIGPITLSLFFTLLDIYFSLRGQNLNQNQIC